MKQIPLMLNCMHPYSAIASEETEVFWCSKDEIMTILGTALDLQQDLFATAVKNLKRLQRFK